MTNQKLLKIAVKAADDKRAEDILALNMQGISLIADYFIICHGNYSCNDTFVIPAKAGIHFKLSLRRSQWIPAFKSMTPLETKSS